MIALKCVKLTLIFTNTNNDRKFPHIPRKHIEPIIIKEKTNLRVSHVTETIDSV